MSLGRLPVLLLLLLLLLPPLGPVLLLLLLLPTLLLLPPGELLPLLCRRKGSTFVVPPGCTGVPDTPTWKRALSLPASNLTMMRQAQ